jgi:predicted PhzF superfamily epimerase YddE/YHI9
MKYPFHIVDVFSSTPFGGNRLAVLPNARTKCPQWPLS